MPSSEHGGSPDFLPGVDPIRLALVYFDWFSECLKSRRSTADLVRLFKSGMIQAAETSYRAGHDAAMSRCKWTLSLPCSSNPAATANVNAETCEPEMTLHCLALRQHLDRLRAEFENEPTY